MKPVLFVGLLFCHLNWAGVDTTLTQAAFPGGDAALEAFIQNKLEYPMEARENGMEGEVEFRLLIDETGKIVTVQILECDCPVFEPHTRKLVEQMPHWIPAKLDGNPIPSAVKLKIHFALQ